jgi:LCP family protein required for cell wall assembly
VGNKRYKSYSGSLDGIVRPARGRVHQHGRTQIPVQSAGSKSISQPAVNTPPSIPTLTAFGTSSPYANQPRSSSRSLRPKIKRGWSRRRKIVSSVFVVLLIGFAFGGWYGARLVGNLDKVFHGNVFSDVHALVSQTKLKGEDQGRVNILLAGDSADDPHHGGAQLTDSIMVVSIDTKDHTGFMLSIPRDLWVNIPNWSHQKINAANDVTSFSQAGYPKGGMGQLEQIVQTNLGIPIDYYALINYAAFKDAVNAVGGITINIQSSDPRGLFDPNISKADGGPLKLPNGTITLNGQTALDLARARGDPCGCGQYEYGFPQSDYNRTQHQRQMLSALASKAQTAGVIANPIKIDQLFNSFGNNIATDLNLQDVLRFVQITKGMSASSLQPLALANSGQNALLSAYTAPDGEEALIPKAGIDDFGAIQQYYQQLTSDSPVVKEATTVVILNASSATGLAHKEEAALQAKGFNVVGAYDANGQYPNSMIVDLSNNQKPASKQLLQSIFTRNTTTVTSTSASTEANEAASYNANFVVILGQSSVTTTNP